MSAAPAELVLAAWERIDDVLPGVRAWRMVAAAQDALGAYIDEAVERPLVALVAAYEGGTVSTDPSPRAETARLVAGVLVGFPS